MDNSKMHFCVKYAELMFLPQHSYPIIRGCLVNKSSSSCGHGATFNPAEIISVQKQYVKDSDSER